MVAMEELHAAANNSLAACSGMQSTKKNAHENDLHPKSWTSVHTFGVFS